MKFLRWKIVGTLCLAFFPIPWHFFHLVIPPAYAEAPAKGPPCTWSKSASIRLPLQTDEKARAFINEIKLYVKAPGDDWVVAQSGPPSRASFDYKAEKDGSYSFMFVTVDKTGRSVPSDLDSRSPHQVIVIDTAAPELSVMPLPVANRDIYLQCRMKDSNPDWASIKLEYMIGENSWREMDLVQLDTPGVFRIPHASVLEGKVRASARDKAGNLAQRIVDLGDPTQSFNVPEKQTEPPLAPSDSAKVEPQILPGNVQVSHKQSAPPEAKRPELDARPTGYNPNRPKKPDAVDPVTIPEPPPIVDPRGTENLKVLTPSNEPEGMGRPGDVRSNQPPTKTIPGSDDPYFPPIKPVAEPVRNEPPSKIEPVSMKVELPVADVRPAAVGRGASDIINTQRCTLEYAVDNVIVGGQPKIEFWATKDNGRTWLRVPDESGGRSPAKLVMPSDGLFGIRVKANGNGQSPHMGEAPDAWVEVDTTRPTVRLLPPAIGTGADAGTLTVQWIAQDKNLVGDSINIYHASRPEGPWLPIATGLRNEGNYRWLIPTGIGAEIYLRLEAVDRAGNVGLGELRDPVSMPQPKVRVIGIGPAR